jgi:hypothetical protein
MTKPTLSVPASIVLFATVTACGAPDENVPTEAPGATHAAFSTTPGEPNHEQITAAGLSFLRPDVLASLQAANVETDIEHFFDNANHFDDCNFTGGSDVVRTSQAAAVAQLNPSNTTPEAELSAIVSFARSLHALQDFYAHTNWIELGGETLVDASLGAFPRLDPYSTIGSSGFVVIQGNKPKRAALVRDDDASYPDSAIVSVKLGKAGAPGLISGTVDYEPGDFCPSSVAMAHEDLNKDKSTLVDRVQQHEAAKALAILQTEHEWCRLRALTQAAWGDAGVARLELWVSADATRPTCD